MCAAVWDTLEVGMSSVQFQCIIFSCNIRQWNGKGVNSVLCLCLFCPVWIIYEQVMIAALDCSRDDLALVSFYRSSSHTQELQKPSFTLSQPFLLCSTPSAKCENLIFIWPNGITLSVLWKNNLLRVGIRGCSKWVEKHASSVSWTWPSFMEFNCFFPQDLFAILKLNVMFLSSCWNIHCSENGQICMG